MSNAIQFQNLEITFPYVLATTFSKVVSKKKSDVSMLLLMRDLHLCQMLADHGVFPVSNKCIGEITERSKVFPLMD